MTCLLDLHCHCWGRLRQICFSATDSPLKWERPGSNLHEACWWEQGKAGTLWEGAPEVTCMLDQGQPTCGAATRPVEISSSLFLACDLEALRTALLLRPSAVPSAGICIAAEDTFMDTRFCRAQLVKERPCSPAQAAASIRGLLLQGTVDANIAGNLLAAAEALERQHDKGAAHAQEASRLKEKPAAAGEALPLSKN